MFLPVFHLLVIAINSFTIWYDQYLEYPFPQVVIKQNLSLNNRILFLTFWGIVLQTIYFTLALLNDIFGTNERSPKKTPIIRQIKDAVFSLAFPIAIYVFTLFWVIYLVDKDLIFPEVLAKVMPVWVNHVMHTFIAPFILLELLLTPRNYPSRKTGIRLITAFVVCYLIYLNYVYVISGTFVYPFLDVLNWPLRIVYFTVNTFLGMGMYVLGETIDSMVNSSGQVNASKRR